MQDKKLKCKICGNEFDFTTGEQEFFKKHNLSEPKKCQKCKEIEKKEKNQNLSNQKNA